MGVEKSVRKGERHESVWGRSVEGTAAEEQLVDQGKDSPTGSFLSLVGPKWP